MIAFHRTLQAAFLAAGSTLACAPAMVQASPASCPFVSSVERRIVERSETSMETLHSFVRVTAFVHGVTMLEVRDHLDDWRAAVECRRQAVAASNEAGAVDRTAALAVASIAPD